MKLAYLCHCTEDPCTVNLFQQQVVMSLNDSSMHKFHLSLSITIIHCIVYDMFNMLLIGNVVVELINYFIV